MPNGIILPFPPTTSASSPSAPNAGATRLIDGSEELYDHSSDPNEWTNLAADPQYESVKREHARWIPATEAPEAPGKDAYDFDFEKYEWTKK